MLDASTARPAGLLLILRVAALSLEDDSALALIPEQLSTRISDASMHRRPLFGPCGVVGVATACTIYAVRRMCAGVPAG